MTLEKQDAELFYELWFPLLDFVNKKNAYRLNAASHNILKKSGLLDR